MSDTSKIRISQENYIFNALNLLLKANGQMRAGRIDKVVVAHEGYLSRRRCDSCLINVFLIWQLIKS